MTNNIWLKLRACKNLVLKNDSFIYATGWINSIDQLAPVDMNYSPIPWMNYHFIDFVSKRLHKDMHIFEYGSGYSTSYWAKLVRTVTSVEYDKEWFQKVGSSLPDNARLIFNDKIDSDEYAKSCLIQENNYDVIVVDGRNRVSCMLYSLPKLKPNGVIILDDSHRERYREGFELLKDKGFKEITITGIKPVSSSFAATTVFYKSDNCLNI